MITDEQRQLIREMLEHQTVNEIAKQLGIGEKTVRRYKKTSVSVQQKAETDTEGISIISNDTTTEYNLSSSKQDELRGRHYAFVVYPTEEWVKEHVPQCEYDGSDGWGEAPNDWQDQLQNTGLAFVVSPLHYLDVNPDGKPKKPHWHIIISWGNTTTYRSARAISETILHCPRPQMLKAVEGMYRYLTHKDNPEKHQYDEIPRCFNGWERPLDNVAITELKREIRKLIYLENCTEYGELVAICEQKGNEYFDVVSSHTYFFDKLCSSFRHNPIRTLSRVLPEYDGEETKTIYELLKKYSGGYEDESNN